MKGNGISQAGGDRANAPLKAQISAPRRILVVEDDICLRRLNTQVLSRSGYEVDGAADGAIAWQALSTDCYDLLVTAHDIPKLTGIELVRKMRAARMALPVVMATGTFAKRRIHPAALAATRRDAGQALYCRGDVEHGETGSTRGREQLRGFPIVYGSEQKTANCRASMKAPHLVAAQNGSVHSRPTSPSPAKKCDPAKTLLVVDDDPMVRDVEAQVLRLQGYTVLEAQGAAEALLLARKAAEIHLLITDFSMPEVDGLELSRQFRLVHPKSPVLMVSGSFPLIQNRADDFDRFEFLAKPFQYDELLHKVRALLDAAAPLPLRRPSRYE